MFQAIFMSFSPYFVCALLGVDSLRGGLAKATEFLRARHLIPHLGVCDANDRKRVGVGGVYDACACA